MKIEKLAIHGGEPVRKEPLPKPYIGSTIYGKEEKDLLTEVVENQLPFRDYGAHGTPHMVNDFENLARDYFAMPYALGTATGSGAFFCAMAGLGIGPGDEVIIPALSWHTDFMAPVHFGAVPVVVDIDKSMNMSVDAFEAAITERTKAVIVVHYQGVSNNMERLLKIAEKHNIKVIEDVAQACGADYKGKKLGSLGDVSCFSFQQNKILTTGDGGLLLAKDPEVFERAVRYHDLGGVRKGPMKQLDNKVKFGEFCAGQFRMNEFTGAVALAQLRKLDSHILNPVRKMCRHIKDALNVSCPGIKYRQTGDDKGDAGIALFMDMETPERAAWFREAMVAEGIREGASSGCANILEKDYVRNKVQVHPDLPPFGKGFAGENVQYNPATCPNVNTIQDSMACVAIVPAMTEQDAEDVITAISKIWRNMPEDL
jgi:dTDP-4-amino-4,6-dideoxygalactose transaminase